MAGKRDLDTARTWGREVLKTHELQKFDYVNTDGVIPIVDVTEINAEAQPKKLSISGVMHSAIQDNIVAAAGASFAFDGDLEFAGGITLNNTASGVYTFYGTSGKDASIVLNCEVNSHGVTLKSPPHSAGATWTWVLPESQGAAGQALRNDGSGNLYWG